jgi:hypothetical protein
MKLRMISVAAAAAWLAVVPAAGTAQASGSAFTVKNSTGKLLACAVKKDGSARTQDVLIKAGEVWTRSYSDAKDRRFRCEGVYSRWHRITAGRAYALVRAPDGRLMVKGD